MGVWGVLMEKVLKFRENIFSNYKNASSVFIDKKVLSSNYIPNRLLHRDQEITQLRDILLPILKGYKPSNIFIYGNVGTGKTISTKFVLNQLGEASNIKTIYMNCKLKKVSDTEYRLLAQILKELGVWVPETGLPTSVLYKKFFEVVEGQNIILVLDEIDALFNHSGNEFLYNISRTETANGIILIGITNDITFKNHLDSRVCSSLSEEEIIFKPYDARQLYDILNERVQLGLNPSSIAPEIVAKCAAAAAQEHGDARKAIDLLRIAAEITDRLCLDKITEQHFELAHEKMNIDRVAEAVKSQPKHTQALLYSIIKLRAKINTGSQNWVDSRVLTGEVYEYYKGVCAKNTLKSLTQRRVSDLITELNSIGIVSTSVVSNGRYGRSREIVLLIENNILERTEKFLNEIFG